MHYAFVIFGFCHFLFKPKYYLYFGLKKNHSLKIYNSLYNTLYHFKGLKMQKMNKYGNNEKMIVYIKS